MIKKKLIIVGADSYIGTSVESWLLTDRDEYEVSTVGTLNDEWKQISFKGYDSVLHVAGIAHVSTNSKMEDLYYKVNRDLAIEVAKKAKEDDVKQFVFMSSIIIYGNDNRIGIERPITKETIPNPTNFYGRSKLEADLAIQNMNCNDFKTVIIRTPMVYGPGCKGNFPKLKSLSKWCLFFPNIKNKRSMIYIDNLCEFIKQLIDNESRGVFYPQNQEYVSTKQIIKTFRELQNKKTYCTKIFNPFLTLLSRRVPYINKVFGNKFYDKKLSKSYEYCIVDFKESIERCH